MITHYIYDLPGLKIGCTRNLAERLRHYPRHTVKMVRVLAVLEDKTDQEAGDIERLYIARYRYRRAPHYTVTVNTMTREQRVAAGRRSGHIGGRVSRERGVGIHAQTHAEHVELGRKAALARGPERNAEQGRKVGTRRDRCAVCGAECNLGNLRRWHGQNCRQRMPEIRLPLRRPA